MYPVFNQEQSKGLANFFFDIAKAFVIGSVGFATVGPLQIKMLTMFAGFIVAYICVQFALTLLAEIK